MSAGVRGTLGPGRPPVGQVGTPKRPPCGGTRSTAGDAGLKAGSGAPHLPYRPGWR